MLGNAAFPASGAEPCVVENRLPWRSPPMIELSWNRSPAASRCRGIKSVGLEPSWRSLKGSEPASWPSRCSVMSRPSAAPVNATAHSDSMGYWTLSRDQAARPGFPPLQRAQIVELACLEPMAQGLHITHWTSKDLALRQEARAKEEETRNSETLHWNPAGERIPPGRAWPAAGSESCVGRSDPHCEA